MGLFCILWQRALARYAVLQSPLPRGSRIEAHVGRCAECRAYLDDLQRLSTTLSTVIVSPQPPVTSLMPTEDWQVARRPRPKLRLAPSLALACAALGIGTYVWSQLRRAPQTVPGNVAVDILPRPGHKAIALDTDARRVKGTPGKRFGRQRPRKVRQAQWASVEAPHRRSARRKSPGSPRPASVMVLAAASVRPPAEQDRSTSACAWQTVGAELEAQGETQMAETAYRLANAEEPSADYALDVGRNAEKNGKLEQALDCYADLLGASSEPALDKAALETKLETKGITP